MHPIDAFLKNEETPLSDFFRQRVIEKQILPNMEKTLDSILEGLVEDEEITLERKKFLFVRESKKLRGVSEKMFDDYWGDGELNELINPEGDWYYDYLDDVINYD